MKHDSRLPYASALPDAPMAMPKQMLERRQSLFATLRGVLSVLPWF